MYITITGIDAGEP